MAINTQKKKTYFSIVLNIWIFYISIIIYLLLIIKKIINIYQNEYPTYQKAEYCYLFTYCVAEKTAW